jgi:endoplasmic reticulum-Golgi intermediate compartment protein 3
MKVDHLYVNTTRSTDLTIDFDISFSQMSCNLLAVDAYDDTGVTQIDAVHEIYKHRLSAEGEKLGLAEQAELGHTLLNEAQLEALAKEAEAMRAKTKELVGVCGNCYGAGRRGQCCNTCQDVKDAYDRLGWKFKPQGIVQCSSEAYISTLREQYADDGGCQVYGRLQLSKSSGHFHIAPTKKVHEKQANGGVFNLLDLISFTFDQFNVTHRINSLSFGDQFPGIRSPLDGQVRKVQDTHAMYQYFIKVVPTRYKALDMSTEIQSNQYSATEHMSTLAPGSGRGLPGVYFYYEVSPIQAYIEEKPRSWLHFLTSVCAIVGGAYSLMSLVDLFLGYLTRKDYALN